MAKFDTRVIGGTLLVVGTSIGGALLVLPVANASSGLMNSSIFLILSWALMTFSGFLMLEVNLWLPAGSNVISMAKATLGRWGQVLAWLWYLLLLYTLLSAYTAGGTDMLQNLASIVGLHLAQWEAALLFSVILGYVVYLGIRSVDLVNRGLMFGKLGIYLLLILLIAPHLDVQKLHGGELKYVTGAIMLMVVSFGFGSIVPSLRNYMDGDVKKLRIALFLGTTIPLFCYIAWDLVIMGALPKEGVHGLVAMNQSDHAAVALIGSLSDFIHSPVITYAYRIFTSVCVLTAFLSVSLSLVDFLADGLNLPKTGKTKFGLHVMTFVPPLFIVTWMPGMFKMGLTYAGVICVILFALMPVLMAWRGRYVMRIAPDAYQVFGGRVALSGALLLALALTAIAITQVV